VVTVRGAAGPAVQSAFDDVELVIHESTTDLRPEGNDQAVLHALLRRAQDLGLEVVEVRREPRNL
jgi:hypothetical protein